MSRIIIFDTDKLLSSAESSILEKAGYDVTCVRSEEEALNGCHRISPSLIIADTDIGGEPGRGLKFFEFLRRSEPHLPFLMTTNRNIDEFMDELLRLEIGNILVKPIPRDSLLNVTEKLINGDKILGIQNYLHDILDMKKLRVISSSQIPVTIEKIIDYMKEWGFSGLDESTLKLLIQENLTNAVYHSHGKADEKMARSSIELDPGRFVEVVLAHNGKKFGIGIIDFNGKLTKSKILHTLYDVTEQDRRLLSMASGETSEQFQISDKGRGIDLLRKLAAEYYFNIRHNYMTEILMIFDLHYSKDDNYSSINVFEID